MGFIMFWLQFRSLLHFNNCDSAKHPSPQEIPNACLASGAHIYLRYTRRTLGHGEADLGGHSSPSPQFYKRGTGGLGWECDLPKDMQLVGDRTLRRFQMASEKVHAAPNSQLGNCR